MILNNALVMMRVSSDNERVVHRTPEMMNINHIIKAFIPDTLENCLQPGITRLLPFINIY